MYNFLTLLGDVGGLTGIILSMSASLMSLITFSNAENYIAKSLYQTSYKNPTNFEVKTKNLDH